MADVVAGLMWKDGLVLLGKRKASGKRGGLWEMPGGKCDERLLKGDLEMRERVRECHEEALAREWREELGIDIAVGPRVSTALLDLETCFTVTLYAVYPVAGGGDPRPLDHEELRWVSLKHAIEYMPCSPAMYLHYQATRAFLWNVLGHEP